MTTNLITKIARAANALFSKDSVHCFPEQHAKLVSLMQSLKTTDVNLDPLLLADNAPYDVRSSLCPVAFIKLFQNELFTISIFIVRNGARIPLHDHPGMYGLIKVIHGAFGIQSYTKCADSSSASSDKFMVRKHKYEVITVDSDVCSLDPEYGNLHDLKALEGTAAFLDILGPPYDECVRECHYFRVGTPGITNQLLNLVSGKKANESHGDVVELQRIAPPRDFWSVDVAYKGPAIEISEVCGDRASS